MEREQCVWAARGGDRTSQEIAAMCPDRLTPPGRAMLVCGCVKEAANYELPRSSVQRVIPQPLITDSELGGLAMEANPVTACAENGADSHHPRPPSPARPVLMGELADVAFRDATVRNCHSPRCVGSTAFSANLKLRYQGRQRCTHRTHREARPTPSIRSRSKQNTYKSRINARAIDGTRAGADPDRNRLILPTSPPFPVTASN